MTRKQTTPHAGAVKPDERPGALAGGDLLDAPGPFQRTTHPPKATRIAAFWLTIASVIVGMGVVA